MKNIFNGKSIGFYFTVATGALSLIEAIVYAVSYANFTNQGVSIMSWPLFVLLMVLAAINVALIFLNKSEFAPYVSAALALSIFCLYIYSMYWYISVMAYGIDAQINATFIINSLLVVLILGVSFANVFLRQKKPSDARQAEEGEQ